MLCKTLDGQSATQKQQIGLQKLAQSKYNPISPSLHSAGASLARQSTRYIQETAVALAEFGFDVASCCCFFLCVFQICVAHPVCRLYSHHNPERIQEAARGDGHHHQCALAYIQGSPLYHLLKRFVLNKIFFRCVNVAQTRCNKAKLKWSQWLFFFFY